MGVLNIKMVEPSIILPISVAAAAVSFTNFWIRNEVVNLSVAGSVWAHAQDWARYAAQGGRFFAEQIPSLNKEKNSFSETQVTKLVGCHMEFCERLDKMVNPSAAYRFLDSFSEDISEIMYNYDHCISHVPEPISDLFFNYSNLLEAVLLVINKRHLDISSIKGILLELDSIYHEIYSCIKSSKCDNVPSIYIRLNNLEARAINEGLMPTVEECEEDIEETFVLMSDEEKEDLARLLGN
jgi:hypothetical protein